MAKKGSESKPSARTGLASLPKCWHHPKRDATHVGNLGTKFDLDSNLCAACASQVRRMKGARVRKL